MSDKSDQRSARRIEHELIDRNEPFAKVYKFAYMPMNYLLTDRQRRLFLYYAGCGKGFAPSAKVISKETKLDPDSIYSFRKQLAELGFIQVTDREKDEPIVRIRWDNIRGLNAKLKSGELKIKSKRKDRVKGKHKTGRGHPSKSTGKRDNIAKEATYLPPIADDNHFSPIDKSLTEAERRQIRACESLNVEQYQAVIDNIACHMEEPLPF